MLIRPVTGKCAKMNPLQRTAVLTILFISLSVLASEPKITKNAGGDGVMQQRKEPEKKNDDTGSNAKRNDLGDDNNHDVVFFFPFQCHFRFTSVSTFKSMYHSLHVILCLYLSKHTRLFSTKLTNVFVFFQFQKWVAPSSVKQTLLFPVTSLQTWLSAIRLLLFSVMAASWRSLE